jgi:hypothetical protein
MEHAMHIAEWILAAFGTGKFLHEVVELVSHLVKLVRK